MMQPGTEHSPYDIVYPVAAVGLRPDHVGRLPLSLATRPAAWLYRAVSVPLRDRRLGRRGRPGDEPIIISVGNLEIGGNGKTPLAIHLIERLSERGYRPVYVSRGFKSEAERLGVVTVLPSRSASEFPAVASDVRLLGGAGNLAVAIGDEGAMVAARCPATPLLFCCDRRRAVDAARKMFDPTHIVIDDAFQTWTLPRHWDIVMLDRDRPWGNGQLLPAGSLRETPKALTRADFVGVNGCGSESDLSAFADRIRDACGRRLPVFGLLRGIVFVDSSRLREDEAVGGIVGDEGVERLAPEGTALALSSIARPESFERDLLASGVDIRLALRYPDHYRYTIREHERIGRLVSERGIDRIVTTEKDWAKLSPMLGWSVTCSVARIEVRMSGFDFLPTIEKPQAMPAA